MYGFESDLSESIGLNVIGSFSAEDSFISGRKGFVYVVNKELMSSYINYSQPPSYGETIAAIRNVKNGEVSDTDEYNILQNTLAMRPVFGVAPENGRKNILNFSNKLNQNPWYPSSTAASVKVDDDNNLYERECYSLTFVPNVFGDAYLYQKIPLILDAYRGGNVIGTNGETRTTISVYVKPIKYGLLTETFTIQVEGLTVSNSMTLRFNHDGTIQTVDKIPSSLTGSYYYIDDGWYRVYVNIPLELGDKETFVRFGTNTQSNGDGSSISLSSPQVEYSASQPTMYQDVNNYFDIVNKNGQNVEYLMFDGIDDKFTINIGSDLVGVDGDFFIAGVNKSAVVPYKMTGSTVDIGPKSIGSNLDNLILESGGVVAFGFISPRLSLEEYNKLFDHFEGLGANGSFSYPHQNIVASILDTYVDGSKSYEIFWPDPDNLYNTYNLTSKVNGLGNSIRAWEGKNGTILTNAGYTDVYPILVKLPRGSFPRNSLLDTETFGNWNPVINGSGNTVTVTHNYGISPFNTSGVSRVVLSLNPSAGNNNFALYRLGDNWSNGVTQTFSVWMKSNTNSNYTINIAIDTIAGTSRNIVVTPQWQRFTLTATGNASVNMLDIVVRKSRSTSQYADILMFGPQLEVGTEATTYQIKKHRLEYYELGKKSYWAIRADGVDDLFKTTGHFALGNMYTIFAGFLVDDHTKEQNLVYLNGPDGGIRFKPIGNTTDSAIQHKSGANVVNGLMRTAKFGAVASAMRGTNAMVVWENGVHIRTLGSLPALVQDATSVLRVFNTEVTGEGKFGGYCGPIIITRGFMPSNTDTKLIHGIINDYMGVPE